jgi:glucose-1-phosphate cytidylyltransferase
MKYYAHHGHKDFVLCLGYRGDVIKNYFLNYSECISNDFVLSEGGRKLELVTSDIQDWTIAFVETGSGANIGQRLLAVEPHVRNEPEFLANYSDGLTDLSLPLHIDHFRQQDAIASFVSVKPNLSYHLVSAAQGGRVTEIKEMRSSPIRINGGFFVFRPEIFDHIGRGEDLVCEPFQRLVRAGRLSAYEHDGFWMSMDTFKDRQQLEDIYARGAAPWELWNRKPEGPPLRALAGLSA